nr:hypothetical protein BaRGS_002260 [Batillaria attramentaria]
MDALRKNLKFTLSPSDTYTGTVVTGTSPPGRISDRAMVTTPRTFCFDNSQLMIQEDEDTPHIASLVVTDGGKIVMTDNENNKDLQYPEYLCVAGGEIFVSDCHEDCVLRVDLATGRVKDTHTHKQLEMPYQMSADRSGEWNMYNR